MLNRSKVLLFIYLHLLLALKKPQGVSILGWLAASPYACVSFLLMSLWVFNGFFFSLSFNLSSDDTLCVSINPAAPLSIAPWFHFYSSSSGVALKWRSARLEMSLGERNDLRQYFVTANSDGGVGGERRRRGLTKITKIPCLEGLGRKKINTKTEFIPITVWSTIKAFMTSDWVGFFPQADNHMPMFHYIVWLCFHGQYHVSDLITVRMIQYLVTA